MAPYDTFQSKKNAENQQMLRSAFRQILPLTNTIHRRYERSMLVQAISGFLDLLIY
jgi:hypothetical protein